MNVDFFSQESRGERFEDGRSSPLKKRDIFNG